MAWSNSTRWLAGAGFAIAVIAAAGAAWLWCDGRVQPIPSEAEIGTIVEERLAAGFGTAMVVGILDDGTRTFVARGEGFGGPAGPDTPFEIASITKVLTAGLMGVMAEAGDLAFGDAAVSLWPANPPLLPDRDGQPITRIDVRVHGVAVWMRPNGFAGLVREVAGNRRAAA
jgi:CubicO group peptidase (beta-lactamase class C family)